MMQRSASREALMSSPSEATAAAGPAGGAAKQKIVPRRRRSVPNGEVAGKTDGIQNEQKEAGLLQKGNKSTGNLKGEGEGEEGGGDDGTGGGGGFHFEV